MLRQSLSQTQIQTLRQELAPQQLQSLEILLATVPELEQKISKELIENPTLEMVDSGTQALAGNPVEAANENTAASEELAANAAEKDEALATLIQLDEAWHDYVPPSYTGNASFTEDDEERRRFMLNSLVDEPSLQDLLQAQLRENDQLDEMSSRICEEIIGSLDDRGYLRSPLEDIALACVATLEQVNDCLKLIQSFDPAGIAARDLRECLLLQLERRGQKGTLVYMVISKHLDALGRNQIPKVAQSLHISPREVYDVLEEIRTLNPFPGSLLAPNNATFVVPEVYVEKDEDNNWRVRTNRECTPRLRISSYYLNLLKDTETPAEVKTYIRQKIADSKVLLRALDQRQSTIERITHSLLKFQEDFFERGINALKPLILNQVAEDIGVHETTVSRAVSNKYIQSPHGIMPFKHFFSSGLESTSGEMVSSRSIKNMIEDLIKSENPAKPFSDDKLAKLLKERGNQVARRTVAKYREELGILPSHMRRSY